jgi:hypothetical protein
MASCATLLAKRERGKLQAGRAGYVHAKAREEVGPVACEGFLHGRFDYYDRQ